MKLRHGKNFGSYAGTCWRLLFTFALAPWMRKYRLSRGDNIEVTSFRFAAMRMWTGRMPKQALSADTAVDDTCDREDQSDPQELIKSLRKQLAHLQSENDMLRHFIFQPMNSSPNHRKHLSMSMPNAIR